MRKELGYWIGANLRAFRLFPTVFSILNCRSFVATFEGDSRIIRPGTESTVCVIFSPKFEGLFEAELKLVFYDVRRLSRFVIRRRLQGIAGSIEDHNLFESLDQESETGRAIDYRYVPPQTVISLLQPDGRWTSQIKKTPRIRCIPNGPAGGEYFYCRASLRRESLGPRLCFAAQKINRGHLRAILPGSTERRGRAAAVRYLIFFH